MFFCFWRTSTQFLKKILLSESCANFLEWFAELAEIFWKFPHSLCTPSLTHTLPCLLVNPIPHRRYQGAWKLHAADECGLPSVLRNHRCVLLRGTFFPQVADQCAILQEISPLRILLEFSRVARRTWRKFLEFFSLHSNSLAHLHLPCLRVNPISHRRHPGAGKLHKANERGLLRMQSNHRWVLLRGMFFSLDADQCAFLGEFSSMRILREFSRVARRTCRNFLEISSLHSSSLLASLSLSRTHTHTHTLFFYLNLTLFC